MAKRQSELIAKLNLFRNLDLKMEGKYHNVVVIVVKVLRLIVDRGV
jgi:hypothetical protein